MRQDSGWLTFFWRVSSCHIVSYLVMGLLSMVLLNYEQRFATGSYGLFMRPTDAALVMLAPALQVVRGLLFSIVLWPFRGVFLDRDNGWLALWGLFLGLAILGPTTAGPGSIEGLFYTKLSIGEHLFSLPEVVIQTLLFSLGVHYWYRRPSRVLNIVMGVLVALVVLMSVGGFAAA